MIEELLSFCRKRFPSEGASNGRQTLPDFSTYRDQEPRQSRGYRGLVRKLKCRNCTYFPSRELATKSTPSGLTHYFSGQTSRRRMEMEPGLAMSLREVSHYLCLSVVRNTDGGQGGEALVIRTFPPRMPYPVAGGHLVKPVIATLVTSFFVTGHRYRSEHAL